MNALAVRWKDGEHHDPQLRNACFDDLLKDMAVRAGNTPDTIKQWYFIPPPPPPPRRE